MSCASPSVAASCCFVFFAFLHVRDFSILLMCKRQKKVQIIRKIITKSVILQFGIKGGVSKQKLSEVRLRRKLNEDNGQ